MENILFLVLEKFHFYREKKVYNEGEKEGGLYGRKGCDSRSKDDDRNSSNSLFQGLYPQSRCPSILGKSKSYFGSFIEGKTGRQSPIDRVGEVLSECEFIDWFEWAAFE